MIHSFVEPIVLAICEGDPINFSRTDPRGVKRALRAIERSNVPAGAQLREWLSRNEFLAACLAFTAEEVREHLIVGYGWRSNRTTRIDCIHHTPGEARKVAVPPEVIVEIRRHHAHRTNAEVVVFHNHPRTGYEPESLFWIKALLDDLPMPSSQDRTLVQELSFTRLGMFRHLLDDGRVLFYLGESGYVRQIKLPNLLSLLSKMTHPGIRG